MKQTYIEPEVQVLSLSLETGVLTASNEGYPVNPVNPGFSPFPSFSDFPSF